MSDDDLSYDEQLAIYNKAIRDRSAANLRIVLDERLMRPTPDYVFEIANSSPIPPVPDDPKEFVRLFRRDILAARLRVSINRKLGRETPKSVVTLSKLPLPSFLDE